MRLVLFDALVVCLPCTLLTSEHKALGPRWTLNLHDPCGSACVASRGTLWQGAHEDLASGPTRANLPDSAKAV